VESIRLRTSKAARRCPYCKGTLDRGEATWTCELCSTVHHEDCARAYGRCTLAGCRGIAFPAEPIAPTIQEPAEPVLAPTMPLPRQPATRAAYVRRYASIETRVVGAFGLVVGIVGLFAALVVSTQTPLAVMIGVFAGASALSGLRDVITGDPAGSWTRAFWGSFSSGTRD
jgi:hypothetical protein